MAEKVRVGFHAFVGNPPFLGGKRISTNLGGVYRAWLAERHPDASSNTDLSAHFFRRAFDLLGPGGAFGFIATNTIAQGDTRAGGLRAIAAAGGTIYDARRRMPWPGIALVVVSLVHVFKGWLPPGTPVLLDCRPVGAITSFLFHQGGDDAPRPLPGRTLRAYIGTFLRGSGFLFDDESPDATPLAEMRRLLEDPRNRQRIRPYLGGEEINVDPRHAHRRWVIDFTGLSEEEARRWPALMGILERRVRPFRESLGDSNTDAQHKRSWWRFAQERPGLYASTRDLSCVTAVARVTTHLGFVRLPTDLVYSDQVVVFGSDRFSTLAILQSRVHEVWARAFSSSFADNIRYAPSDCFETSPMPGESAEALEAQGQRYYAFRARLMVGRDEGLTKTYNRFHDRDEHSPEILEFRDLHAQMDRAVLDAYGWTDIQPVHAFREQLDERTRLTWDDETRDEVLARLLQSNREMAPTDAEAAKETDGGAAVAGSPRKRKARRVRDEATAKLFGDKEE